MRIKNSISKVKILDQVEFIIKKPKKYNFKIAKYLINELLFDGFKLNNIKNDGSDSNYNMLVFFLKRNFENNVAIKRLELLNPIIDNGILSSVSIEDIFNNLAIGRYRHKNMWSYLVKKKQFEKLTEKQFYSILKNTVTVKSSFFLESMLKNKKANEINQFQWQFLFEKALISQRLDKVHILMKNNKNLDLSFINNDGLSAFNLLTGNFSAKRINAYGVAEKSYNEDYIRNEVMPFLIRNDFDFNKENKFGKTPLMTAIKNDVGEIIADIIKAGGKFDYINEKGEGPQLIFDKFKRDLSKETITVVEHYILKNDLGSINKINKPRML